MLKAIITGRFDGGGEEGFSDLRYGYMNCFIYLKTRDANKSSRIPAVIMNLRGLWGGTVQGDFISVF
jgi:hypothetical protein